MKRGLISLYIVLFCSILTISAEEQYIYTRISNRDGLPSTVNSIYKEKDGNIWLGTPSGLYTFNGHDLKHFEDSLFRNRFIQKIEEDQEGGIWVLTDNWLMHRRKEETGFTHLKAESKYNIPPFYCMCHDKEGLWFGSHGSIYRYTYKDKKFSLFCYTEGWDSICQFLNKVDDTTLICSSRLGSILINTETKEITETSLGPISEVSGTMTDSKGRLWISFYNHGIRVYDKDWTLLKNYTTRNSSLSNDLVICFTEKDSKIWAGTDGGGINIIDPETDNIRVLSHISGDASSFPAHSIKSLHTDNYGNIWAGATREGLITAQAI